MSYSIHYEKEVFKFLDKLDKHIADRIVDKINSLKQNPYPSDSKRIVNVNDKIYRIRVGRYKVLYRVEDGKIIIIFLIEKETKFMIFKFEMNSFFTASPD